MVMTPTQAGSTGRFFGWFIAVSLLIAVLGGLLLGEFVSFGLALAVLVVGVAWTVLTLPLVWLLARLSGRKKPGDAKKA
jgi:hypothetical protein